MISGVLSLINNKKLQSYGGSFGIIIMIFYAFLMNNPFLNDVANPDGNFLHFLNSEYIVQFT
jgi:hypothetical protein